MALPARAARRPLSVSTRCQRGRRQRGKNGGPRRAESPSAFDCFYVYPTVTASAATSNTGTAVTPALEGAAVAQASRFSQVCNVWAPTYRQRTSASLAEGLGADTTADQISYESLLAGWKDYLAHDNDGRPIVFIGHSQGAANLIRLLRSQVDGNPALRDRMVSAIILGGNVQVPAGKTVGGTFAHIPACTKTSQTGCVIAYSSFSSPPPSDSLFGRPGQGVSLQSDQKSEHGQRVVCTNPAALGGTGAAPLTPFFVASALRPGNRGSPTPVSTRGRVSVRVARPGSRSQRAPATAVRSSRPRSVRPGASTWMTSLWHSEIWSTT